VQKKKYAYDFLQKIWISNGIKKKSKLFCMQSIW